MARFVFRLPDIGGARRGRIVNGYVRIGNRAQGDQSLIDVMTDKAAWA